QVQCFMLFIVLFAAIGAWRGWNREVIACAFVLGTVLFLTLGGLSLITNLLAHGLTGFVGTASAKGLVASGGTVPPGSGGGSGGGSTQAPSYNGSVANCPLPVSAQVLSALIFGGMTWLGYRASYKYGQPPRTQGHHLAGMIPGAINGASIAYYVSNAILPSQVVVETPNSSLTANFLPLVFGLGLLGLLVVLLVANQSNKSAKP
ncbi:MAG TPA: hypothetical protein VE258_03400, partial [Ktedonobacterales bacterium]|nr:hypothetical protein [Ktedonobacterales bacterium]